MSRLQKRVGICLHIQVNSVIKGNITVDFEDKKALGCQVAILAPVVHIEPQPQLHYIIQIKQQAGPYMNNKCVTEGKLKKTNKRSGVHMKETLLHLLN